MTRNRIATLVIAVLLTGVVVLSYGVHRKMVESAVENQSFGPLPVPATTAAAPLAGAPVAVFIGDFTKGTDDGGMGDKNWTSILVADVAKTVPLRSLVVGEGSGYVVRRSSPTFVDQVRRFVTPEDRVVVISGSRNDVTADPREVAAAAAETFTLVHTLAPGASLIVIGPTWGAMDPSPEVLATGDAVRQAAAGASAAYVDPIELKWFTSGEPGLVGADNVHPTDLANLRIVESIMPVFSRALT